MHKAPTVDYPVGPSRFHIHLLLAVGLCAIAAEGAWCYLVGATGWPQWLGLALATACGVFGLHTWRVSPRGNLRWNGTDWSLECMGLPIIGAVTVHLDLQSVMLLRFEANASARQWLWLQRSDATARWDALRRAVYAPVPGDGNADQATLATEPARWRGPTSS